MKVDHNIERINKKIFIRVDGNATIGMGHVMRCLSIAEQLRKNNIDIVFITSDDTLNSLFMNKGFKQYSLCSKWNNLEGEFTILGPFLNSNKPNMILVDSYFVSEKYLTKLRKYSKVYYIDDLKAFDAKIDGIINYNIYGENMNYDERLYKKLCLGPRYAPLRNEFLINQKRVFKGVKEVLITSGGTDEYNVIGNILKYFQEKNIFDGVEFYCVIGKFNKNINQLKKDFAKDKNIHFLLNISNISHYMKQCDVAITAGGSTCYELCACGTPSIMYTLADNQILGAKSFSDKNIIPWIGDIRNNINQCLIGIEKELNILNNQTLWENRSSKMQQLVDGKGAKRLADILAKEV